MLCSIGPVPNREHLSYRRLEIVMGYFNTSPEIREIITELRRLRETDGKVDVVFGGAVCDELDTVAAAKETTHEDNIEMTHQTNVHAKQMVFREHWEGENTLTHGTSAG